MDIRKVLAKNAPAIDTAIEGYIPKKLTLASLEKAAGKARYAYSVESAQAAVNTPIWELLGRGGKRWRPTLFLLIAQAFGAKPKPLLDLAMVAEVVHNGTLMVDDVEDNSDLRRGLPCIHKIHGVDVAVNAGNAMYFLPLLAFMRHRGQFSEKTMLAAYEIYAQEMINLSYGQGFDIWWHRGNEPHVTEAQYLQMCAFKTGTLSRMAAKLGALFAGASEKDIALAGQFAEAIGIAFQIQDDILNLVADELEYGKEIGGDITEGKRTLMTIHALSHAPAVEKARLLSLLESHPKDQPRIREAIRILESNGSIDYARAYAKKLVTEAWKNFAPELKEGEAKESLQSFADYLIERDT